MTECSYKAFLLIIIKVKYVSRLIEMNLRKYVSSCGFPCAIHEKVSTNGIVLEKRIDAVNKLAVYVSSNIQLWISLYNS